MNTNLKGNIALGKAIAYFVEQEYIISLPINDSQWYDLIIEKNNVFQTVQVKYTSEKRKDTNNYICTIKTTSGTSRQKLYSIIDTPVDLLFCYCENGDQYLIPVNLITNKSYITLSREKLIQGFDTSNYYVK